MFRSVPQAWHSHLSLCDRSSLQILATKRDILGILGKLQRHLDSESNGQRVDKEVSPISGNKESSTPAAYAKGEFLYWTIAADVRSSCVLSKQF